MMAVLIALLVLVIAVVVGVVSGKVGSSAQALDTMDGATRTSAFELPEGPLGAKGRDVIQLDQSLRGYNMVQTDAVLDKLFGEIEALEAEVTQLKADRSKQRLLHSVSSDPSTADDLGAK